MTAAEPLAVVGGLATLLVVKASLVALAGALAIGVSESRRAGSARAGTVAVCALVALPLLVLVLPRWELPLLAIPHALVADRGPVRSPAAWIGALWLAGTLVALARLANDVRAARGLVRRATASLDARAWPMVRAIATRLRFRGPIELRASADLVTAALLGWRRPVLLLPARCTDWSDEELFAVLRHEMEHVRRRDWLALVVARIAAALYWPNPIVHLVNRRAALARELVADDAVLRAGVRPEAYARRLMAVARDVARGEAHAGAVAFAVDGVDVRVRALFAEHAAAPSPPAARAIAPLATLPLLVVLAAAQPWICLPTPAAPTAAIPVSCP